MSAPRSGLRRQSPFPADRASRASAHEIAPTSSQRAGGDNPALEQALQILTWYVSPPTARSIINLASERGGGNDLRAQLDSIEHSLRLFLTDPAQVRRCREALDELADAQPKTRGAAAVPIRSEEDIVRARLDARRIAVLLDFSTVGLTRLMTAVSEVARNIVLYAGQGQIEIVPIPTPRGVEVTARDRGPGIPNLEQILAGNYKSRLGMGLGLRGVKKLADQFEVQTGAGSGTTVRFVLKVS